MATPKVWIWKRRKPGSLKSRKYSESAPSERIAKRAKRIQGCESQKASVIRATRMTVLIERVQIVRAFEAGAGLAGEGAEG